MNTTEQQPPSKIQQFNSVAGNATNQYSTGSKSSHNYNYYHNELSTIGMRIRYNLDQHQSQSQSQYQGMGTDNSYSVRSYAGVIIPQYRHTVTLNVEPPMLGNQRSVSGSSASSFQLFNDNGVTNGGKNRRGEDGEREGEEEEEEEEYVYSNGKRRLY